VSKTNRQADKETDRHTDQTQITDKFCGYHYAIGAFLLSRCFI